ncbi:MAG: GTP-binding protein [Deltaproteobacteria bacterium]|nr:GTP-binding protein [Deltaproteobacteria bacterium]
MSDTVVIVNDFGDIGIDSALLQGEKSDIIELTTGCICCTLILDLRILLNRIWERFSPRWIFIEASGVADPASLISLFSEEEFKSRIEAFKNLTVLDADCWEMREIMGELFHRQIESADMILLNKVDLLDSEKVRQCLKEVREALPQTPVMPTVHCRIDPESILWEADSDEPGRTREKPQAWLHIPVGERKAVPGHHNHAHDHDETLGVHATEAGFVAFSFQDPRPVDEACFKRFVDELPFEVFRMKGTVRLKDRTVFVSHVGGRSEYADCAFSDETRLAFVGWEIDGEDTIQELHKCLLSEESGLSNKRGLKEKTG